MRVYVRKTDRPPIDVNVLLQAVKAVFIEKKPKSSTARNFNITKSKLRRTCDKLSKDVSDFTAVTDQTLLDYLKSYAIGTKSVFTRDEEKDLIKYIAESGEQSYNLSSKEVRMLAYKYAVTNRVNYPDSWGIHQMAGKDWFCGFMERNENLSLCTPDEIDDKHGTISEMNLDTNQEVASTSKCNVKTSIKNQDVASTSKACVQETDPLDNDTANQLLMLFKKEKQSGESSVNKRKTSNNKKMPPTKKSR